MYCAINQSPVFFTTDQPIYQLCSVSILIVKSGCGKSVFSGWSQWFAVKEPLTACHLPLASS